MPNRLTLCEMSAAVKERQVSPVELITAHLRQIEAVNPGINAFVEVFADEALAAAKAAEASLMKGEAAGRLHGVPITIKDSFDVTGKPTLCGSRFRLGHRAERDSAAAARFRAAGAVLLGKTNTPEFLNNYETDNAITGRTNNPCNLSRTAGGSSGGESAAIAAFCSAGGIGSDGGGSIRIPAHFCGIAGLKPTPGRVSAAGHFPEIAHPGGLLGVGGPMARTAADVQLLFSVLAGYDIEDPFSAPVPLRTGTLLGSGPRIGVWTKMFDTPLEPDSAAVVQKAAEALGRLGFRVDEFTPEGLESAPDLWWLFFERLSAPLTRRLIQGREHEAHWTGTELVYRALKEPPPTMEQTIQALGERDRLRVSLFRQMEHVPILLTPVCATHAFAHRQRPFDLLKMMQPVTVFNLLGMPAMVVPFGIATDGMPIGIQLAARAYDEEFLLEIAVKLEEARGSIAFTSGTPQIG